MSKNWLKSLSRSITRGKPTTHRKRNTRIGASLESLERRETPANFSPGNLVILRMGNGVDTLSTAAAEIFLDEFTPAGSLVQTVAMPNAGAPYTTLSGTSTSEGDLTLSTDGKYLSFMAYDAIKGTANVSTSSGNRQFVMVNSATTTLQNLFTDTTATFGGGSARSAITADGNTLYMAGTAGAGANGGVRIATRGATTSTQLSGTITNMRRANIFGGQLYGSDASGSIRLGTVGSGLPTSPPQTLTNLPGFPTSGGSPYSFFFADLPGGPVGLDTLYVADDSALQGVQKYSFDGTNWSAKGVVVKTGVRGITATVSGSTVTIYGTSGDSTASFFSITDTAGYGNNNNGTLVSLANASANTFYRGIAFAPSVTSVVLNTLITPTNPLTGSSLNYTASFATAVSSLTASNFSLVTTGDVAGVIGTPTTGDGGITWDIPVTSVTGDGTMRLDMVNTTGTTPAVAWVPFTQGTLVTVDHLPVVNTLDFNSGLVSYAGGKTFNNDVTIGLSAGKYTLTDSSDTIALTAAAIGAGWTGNGTNTITGPDSTTLSWSLKLNTGTDSLTLTAMNDPFVALGGGDSGDTLNLPVSITYAGSVSATQFDLLSVNGSATLAIDSITLGASAIGASGTPIHTKSLSVIATASTGGVFIEETDGASFTVNSAADVGLETKSGTLTIAGASTFTTGPFTMTSPGDVVVNADVGSGAATGNIVITANTDGSGSESYTQSATAKLTTTATGSIDITVNTGGGGTGNAELGQGSTASTGSVTVQSFAGSILWTPTVPLLLSSANNQILQSGNFTFTTNTGGSASIGTSAKPIQFNPQTTTNLTTATAGAGGVYLTRYGSSISTQMTASATGAGNVQLWSGNGSNNGIEIVSPGVTTDTGSISIRTDDFLLVNGPIGDAGFSGTVLLEANLDGNSSQSLIMSSSNAITTSNTSASAVTLNEYGQGAATFVVASVTIGNITTGSGATVTINAAALLSPDNGTNATRQGAIFRLSGTSIDVGSGAVVLNALANGIGTVANPVTVNAAIVTAATTSTNQNVATGQADGSIYVVSAGAASFTASTTDAFKASSITFDRVPVINLTTNSGVLTVAGPITTGYGDITLNGADGMVLAANVGSATTGSISLNMGSANLNQTAGVITTAAGTVPTTPTVTVNGTLQLQSAGASTATFTTLGNAASQFVIPSGIRAIVDGSFLPSGAVQVDGILGGSGSVGTTTVSNTGTLSAGTSPGKLSVGNLVMNSTSVLVAELNGGTAGIGYDQIDVTGTVDLGGATLQATLGYVPVLNSVLTLVNNDGSDTVTNTFNGLSEGDTVTLGAYDFKLSYKGGSNNNDVTLTSLDGIAADPPTATVQIDSGVGGQRSVVRSITVTFSEVVSFPMGAAAAFQVERLNTSASPGPTGIVTLDAPNVSLNVVTLSFNDPSFAPLAQGESLIDGQYELTIFASKVTGVGGQLDGNGDKTAGDDKLTSFFRLYGDSNGDGFTNLTDFGQFRVNFSPNYSATFDYNNDGLVNLTDFGQFRAHFFPFAP